MTSIENIRASLHGDDARRAPARARRHPRHRRRRQGVDQPDRSIQRSTPSSPTPCIASVTRCCPRSSIAKSPTPTAEAILGGPGDDWIYDGDGHDGGIFGDNGNLFDLRAGLDPVGGDDVLGGGPGQDNPFGEGGNDIMLMSEGTNKFFGDFGFDWVTLRGWIKPEFIELSLPAQPNVPLNFNDLRNRYRYVDGASGWDLDDHIAGS